MKPPATDRHVPQLLFYAYVALLSYLAYRVLQPFLIALAWAGVLALCLWPVCAKLQRRWRWSATRSALAVTLLTALLCVLLVGWTLWQLGAQAAQAAAAADDALDRVENLRRVRDYWAWIQRHVPVLPPVAAVSDRVSAWASAAAARLASQSANLLQHVLDLGFKTIIAFIALFFFLRDGRKMPQLVREVLPLAPDRQERLIKETCDLIAAGIAASLVVALGEGIACGIMFAILGIGSPILWGLLMGICSMLPVVGASIVWLPAAAMLAVEGHWVKGVILAGYGLLLIALLDNGLRPLMLRGKAPMNALLMLIGILGGVATFGLIGLILGPVVVAAMAGLIGTLTEQSNRASAAGTNPSSPPQRTPPAPGSG